MKLARFILLLSSLLGACSAFARQSVEVGISNDFGGGTEHIIRTRLISSDWLDNGTYNNYRHGRETHIYHFGPKNIRYILTTDGKTRFNFEHCNNVFHQSSVYQDEYISDYFNTGSKTYFNLYIEVDPAYNVWCHLETD